MKAESSRPTAADLAFGARQFLRYLEPFSFRHFSWCAILKSLRIVSD